MRITVLGAARPAPTAPSPERPTADPSPSRPVTAEVSLECGTGETVLSALTRHGVAVPSACQAGICRACLVRAWHGDPGPAGSAGLEDDLRADGYFLACQARPAGDLTMALAGGDIYTPARLLSVRREGPALRVRVRPEHPLRFRAGQHVALRVPADRSGTPLGRESRGGDGRSADGRDGDGRDGDSRDGDSRDRDGRDRGGWEGDGRDRDGRDRGGWEGDGRDRDGRDRDGRDGGAELVRVYSFANGPTEAERDGAEFYVRVYPGGAMSTWLASARPGAELSLGRPSGTCCYQPGEPGAPLLLAGTGTGVAPLAAAARDALAHGHYGPIVVLRGAADPSGLYPEAHLPPDPVRVRTCVVSHGEDIVAAVLAEYAALSGPAGTGGPTPQGASSRAGVTQVYLCGGPGVVGRMRRALFLAGQSLRRIHCDEFSPAAGSIS